MERLSSPMTFFFKFLLPISMSAVFALAAIRAFIHPAPESHGGAWVLTVIWVAASCFFSWLTGSLKRVELVGSTLMVSNYLQTVEVPISEIANVYQTRLLSIRPIFVNFKARTVFGDWISFMPPMSFRIFGEDDVVTRLRSLATDANARSKDQ
jgi:hypothetical protein